MTLSVNHTFAAGGIPMARHILHCSKLTPFIVVPSATTLVLVEDGCASVYLLCAVLLQVRNKGKVSMAIPHPLALVSPSPHSSLLFLYNATQIAVCLSAEASEELLR